MVGRGYRIRGGRGGLRHTKLVSKASGLTDSEATTQVSKGKYADLIGHRVVNNVIDNASSHVGFLPRHMQLLKIEGRVAHETGKYEIFDMYLDALARPCSVEYATYMLIYICDRYPKSLPMSYLENINFINPMTNESLYGMEFNLKKTTAFYVKLDHVSRVTKKTQAIVGAHVSGNFRCGISEWNHYDYYSSTDRVAGAAHNTSLSNADKKWISSLTATRISQDHHLFISHRELIQVIHDLEVSKNKLDTYARRDIEERLAAIKTLIDNSARLNLENSVSFNTHAVYMLVAPLFAVRHVVRLIITSENEDVYDKLCKLESQAAKQLQTLFRDDLSAVFEIQVLRNRIYKDVDWKTEKNNRVKTNGVNVSSTDVYRRAMHIFGDAKAEGNFPMKKNWCDYWGERWAKMPNGSIVSQYAEDDAVKKKLPVYARNKASFFASVSNSDHTTWLNRQPEICATASVKYEWGKVRALYGCDVTSFLHADYSMGQCENLLPSYFPVGEKANDNYVKRVISSFNRSVPFCFDYDDFNSQHTTAAMVAVLEAYKNSYKDFLTDEQRSSLDWTIESIQRQTIKNHITHDQYIADGTLMSGWRLTAFMNTMLNRIYLIEAGLLDNVIYSVHNGDDMFAGVDTIQDALNIMRRSHELNIRAQAAKINIGTIGEFLRVDTRSKNATSAQYLARAVSTATHGRVETAKPNDYVGLASSLKCRFDELKERGAVAETVNIIEQQCQEYAANLFNTNIELYAVARDTHVIQGGISQTAPVRNKKIVRKPRYLKNSSESLVVRRMIKVGVDDYVATVKRKLLYSKDTEMSHKLFNMEHLYDLAVDALDRNPVSYELVDEENNRIAYYRGMHKAFKNNKFISPISKLRLLGMHTVALSDKVPFLLRELISSDPQPAKLLSALF
uniref:RNA-directed RNA polymerase n=1 Tax=Erysiphales associated totivirus 13 TaxID=2719843 RepID=A0A6G9EN80_9VIRU|nr:RNA-dependent RNA polymerase [Erysiphales associated totivirus 13]